MPWKGRMVKFHRHSQLSEDPPPTVDESPWPRASATHAFVQSRCLDVPRVTQKNGMKRWKNMEK